MPSELLSSIASGSSGIARLAPDLNYVANKASSNSLAYSVTGIDGSAGLATALSLSGKFVVNMLTFTSLTNESMTIKLTVDGVVIWNSSVVVTGGAIGLLSSVTGSSSVVTEPILCNSSLLLEIQTTTDTSATLSYLARPVL